MSLLHILQVVRYLACQGLSLRGSSLTHELTAISHSSSMSFVSMMKPGLGLPGHHQRHQAYKG